MTLEFNRIVEQIYTMGAMLEKLDFDLSASLDLAQERFQSASDLDMVRERIQWVQSSDISGYRGAAPLDLPNAEAINARIAEPKLPEQALLLAADGGQVYPDEYSPVHYYLINIGLYIYYHGSNQTPEQFTSPQLRYHKAHVHDRSGRVIANRTVDDRRTVAELEHLATAAWERRSPDVPLVALYDNRLMYLPSGDDGREARDLMSAYLSAMVHLHDANAILAGYIDSPYRSRRFMQLLYLLSLEDHDEVRAHQAELQRAGDLEGLRDQQFFMRVLRPGERSALMVQSSPQNKEFKDRGENYEIAFFYLKVHNDYQSRVVRVDIPMWVARHQQNVNALHALILHQCRLQGRNPYPYALTRADELAWVGGKDRRKLEELVNVQVRRVRQELIGDTLPAKMRGKDLARSEKRYHNMWGEEVIDEY